MKRAVTEGAIAAAVAGGDQGAGMGAHAMPFVPAFVTRGDIVWLSGATAYPLVHRHPHDEDELAVPAGIGEQTRACLENLMVALGAAGGVKEDVVKVTIFSTDMDAQDEVNEVYSRFFHPHRPARSHVGVSRLVGPELKVEIEAVAVLGQR